MTPREILIGKYTNPDVAPAPGLVGLVCADCESFLLWVNPPLPPVPTVCSSCDPFPGALSAV